MQERLTHDPIIENPTDGTILVFIPPGEFRAGGSGSDEGGGPNPVTLPGYHLGMHVVTNAQYGRFVEATGHLPAYHDLAGVEFWNKRSLVSAEADHPVVCVCWEDAQAYCAWAGLRLPTELEWEKGARGTDGRPLPWGADPGTWSDFVAKCDHYWEWADKTTRGVRAYPEGRSPWGLYQMLGDVLEWCEDWYDKDAYFRYRKGDLSPPVRGCERVCRGFPARGITENSDSGAPCAWRRSSPPTRRSDRIGFRCARNP